MKAVTAREKALAYKRLVTTFERAALLALVHHPDPSIALQIAWETHRTTEPRPTTLPGRPPLRFKPEAVQWFLGFVEGRLRTDIPAWWGSTLLAAGTYAGETTVFPDTFAPRYGRANGPLETLDGVRVTQASAEVVFRGSGESQRVSTSDPELVKLVAGSRRCSVLFDRGRVYVALHRAAGASSYRLVCLDETTGKVIWVQRVWAVARMAGGQGWHSVSLATSADLLLVFGGESHGLYIEGFDRTNGAPAFRFCSCYWFEFPEK
jgi:hypothetical protein